MLDESRYHALADEAFKRIQSALDELDPDEAEAFMAGDVLTIAFRNGVRCVVNTQRPTRQIWLAAKARAWHFSFDEPTTKWMDDKGRGDELFATVRAVVKEQCGLEAKL